MEIINMKPKLLLCLALVLRDGDHTATNACAGV
jgi:hypothetical protein